MYSKKGKKQEIVIFVRNESNAQMKCDHIMCYHGGSDEFCIKILKYEPDYLLWTLLVLYFRLLQRYNITTVHFFHQCNI